MAINKETLGMALGAALYIGTPIALSKITPENPPQTMEEVDKMCSPARPAAVAWACGRAKEAARRDIERVLNANDSSANSE